MYSLKLNQYATMDRAFASIPADATSLDLSWNNLHKINNAAIIKTFVQIPATIRSINLSYNKLSYKTDAELAQILTAIQPGTKVSLSANSLFENKNPEQCDALLTTLRECNPSLNLDLSYNGETDAQRAKLAFFKGNSVGISSVLNNADIKSQIMGFLNNK